MATYWVRAGAAGTNAGTQANPFNANPGAFAAGVAAATAAGDVIYLHYTATEEVAADTTYTFLNHVSVICVDMDASDALAPMGAAAWIGASGANRSISMNGAYRIYFYGITIRNAGSTVDTITLAGTDGQHVEYESSYIWQGGSGTGSNIRAGLGDVQTFCKLKNTTIRFGNAAQSLQVSGRLLAEGCTVASAGSSPTELLEFQFVDSAGSTAEFVGCDLSHCGANSLVGDSTTSASVARFTQCKLGTAYTAVAPAIAAQTNLNRSSAEVYIFDCSSGDTHGLFGYFNAMGSVVSDAGIYVTAGAAAQSWKITTTANCSFYTPFETPWFGYYNTGTSAITPYVEILRDGSTTAYQDDEVWMDIAAKVTTTSTQSTLYTSRMTLLGTPSNNTAGAGTGSWTGESGTAWSGKCALGSSITPAEVGHIQARIVVGEPSITVYADISKIRN